MSAKIHDARKFYIDGRWVNPFEPAELAVVNPATEERVGTVSMGGVQDVDAAVAAARRAFDSYSRTTPAERRALLERILSGFNARIDEVAQAISMEMGSPLKFARQAQATTGTLHLSAMLEVLDTFEFEEQHGSHTLTYEPIGVCALITPWNWPINQVAAKVVPALAAGCTMVLKPSEFAPLSTMIWAEVLHDAGVPPGVFNLIHGTGPVVGAALSAHPDVDMISFTGSTRAGIDVARRAALTVKRVHQELGGKSPNVLLDDVDLEKVVKSSIARLVSNSGQSCNAPTRMLVPAAKLAQVEVIAKRAAEAVVVGDPASPETTMGPLVSNIQFERVQAYLKKGIEEGAKLIAGGVGRPDGLTRGYYVKPTVFSNVRNDMTIAREEIFGPVLSIIPYETEEDAIRIANDTDYGLAAYVWGTDIERVRRIGSRIRAGQVTLNGARADGHTPFGGFKQSGNGREWGEHGLRDFLEVKALIGA